MAEADVVGHGAEDVDVLRLGAQVDVKLLAEGTVVIGVALRAVGGAEEGSGARLTEDGPELTHPVREEVAASLGPGSAMPPEEELCHDWGGGIGQPYARVAVELRQRSAVEAGVGQGGIAALPGGVRVVVVKPHAVEVAGRQELPEGGHAEGPVGGVGRRDPLPRMGWRTRPAIGAEGCGFRVLGNVRGDVEGVELG
jgi:hypothetical protein